MVYDNTGGQVVLQNPWVNGTKSAPFDECECFLCVVGLGRRLFGLREKAGRWGLDVEFNDSGVLKVPYADYLLSSFLSDFERGGGEHEWVVPRWCGWEAVA